VARRTVAAKNVSVKKTARKNKKGGR
jgi:hypothetical protein